MAYQTAGLIICHGLGACCSHSALWTRQACWALWDLKITSGNAGFWGFWFFLGFLGSVVVFSIRAVATNYFNCDPNPDGTSDGVLFARLSSCCIDFALPSMGPVR